MIKQLTTIALALIMMGTASASNSNIDKKDLNKSKSTISSKENNKRIKWTISASLLKEKELIYKTRFISDSDISQYPYYRVESDSQNLEYNNVRKNNRLINDKEYQLTSKIVDDVRITRIDVKDIYVLENQLKLMDLITEDIASGPEKEINKNKYEEQEDSSFFSKIMSYSFKTSVYEFINNSLNIANLIPQEKEEVDDLINLDNIIVEAKRIQVSESINEKSMAEEVQGQVQSLGLDGDKNKVLLLHTCDGFENVVTVRNLSLTISCENAK